MQITLSAVYEAIDAGRTKKEIKEMFALTAGQYKTLINTPAVAARFDLVKNVKKQATEAEKAAKRAAKQLVIVDDLNLAQADSGATTVEAVEEFDPFNEPTEAQAI